ncbi:MAG: ABC transporter permease [Bacilli bacterium]|nr:ABC transporter permease [Bacilli bacterium]
MSIISPERKNFLLKRKKEKILVNIFRFLIIFIFIILWEILAREKVINTFITSCPSDIINTTYTLMKDGSLFNHIGITIYEIIISFILSFTISFMVSIIMYLIPVISKILDPYLTVLNSLPKVSLGPLIIIWAGASVKSIIVMGLLISIFVTTINLYTYFNNTDNNYIYLMKSFGASKYQILKEVIIPSNIKNIFSSIKVNLSMNYIGVIMGELLVSKKGLGYLITYGSNVFHINLVITSVFILCILSYLMYFLIELINKKISTIS